MLLTLWRMQTQVKHMMQQRDAAQQAAKAAAEREKNTPQPQQVLPQASVHP